MPASQSESSGKTRRAPTAPSSIVSSIPVVNRRTGRLRVLFSTSQIRAAGVGEEQQRQAHLGHGEKYLVAALAIPQLRNDQQRQHSRRGENDRRRHDGPLQSRRDEAVQEHQRDEDGDQGHRSEAQGDRDRHRWLALIGVQHVGRRVDRMEGEAGEDAALDVSIRLVRTRALRHEAEAEPIDRGEGQLGPVVEEARRRIVSVEDVLALARELELSTSRASPCSRARCPRYRRERRRASG